jgi:hypothetical protein
VTDIGRDTYHACASTVVGTAHARAGDRVQGRITEAQLPLAEQSFPGISRFYESLDDKPATFLQLVWAYEGRRTSRSSRPTRRNKRRR